MNSFENKKEYKNNYEFMKYFLKKTAGFENYIVVNRIYIDFMGSLGGGAFLSQMIYWSDRGSRVDGWFYKSYEDWKKEIGVSKYKINNYVKMLKEKKIIRTEVIRVGGSGIVHYKLNNEVLINELNVFIHNQKIESENEKIYCSSNKYQMLHKQKFDIAEVKNSLSTITKNTTENITKNTQERSKNLSEINEITKNVITYLNDKADTTFSSSDTFNVRLVEQLIEHGYSENDLIKVIDKKYQEWTGNEKTESWIRPSTLFKLEKFNDYLNQKVPSKKEESKYPVPTFIKEIEEQEKRKREVEEQAQKNAPELDPQKSEVRKQIEEL